MKKKDIIPQYLQDECKNLVSQKESYTKEEIDQIRRDFDHVLEQRKQLKEAEEYGAIPKEEAAITNVILIAKQFCIQETMKDALRYMEQEMERINNQIKELKRFN